MTTEPRGLRDLTLAVPERFNFARDTFDAHPAETPSSCWTGRSSSWGGEVSMTPGTAPIACVRSATSRKRCSERGRTRNGGSWPPSNTGAGIIRRQGYDNQRYVELAFSSAGLAPDINIQFQVEDHFLAPPGHYYLAVVDSAGVPSVASIVPVQQ